MNWIDAVGHFGSFLSSVTFIPQVVKTWQTKKVDDLSLATIGIISFSTIVWLIYGIGNQLWPVILCNAFIFLLSLVLWYMKLRYGSRKS